MYEGLKKTYHFSSWRQRAKDGGALLVRNFAPWAKDFSPWTQATYDLFAEAPQRRLLRTVWDDPKEKTARVLVDVREATSFAQAQQCLLEVLANNQLARLPEGPADLGDIAFVHPQGMPPAVFWVVGNLCLSMCSFGRKPTPVLDWAVRLQARIHDKPEGGKLGLVLASGKATARVDQPVTLRVVLPKTQSSEACIKFFAPGAELSLSDEEAAVRPHEKGKLIVEVYATEPGRKASKGRIVLTVK
jgi:hypothetical protein